MNPVAPPTEPARLAGTCDADEFQLPVAGLFADMELGRGSVRLPDDFGHAPSLAQLLILGDWQRALTRYRSDALRRLEHELSRGSPELSAGERLALLRSTCKALRIELPGDLACTPT